MYTENQQLYKELSNFEKHQNLQCFVHKFPQMNVLVFFTIVLNSYTVTKVRGTSLRINQLMLPTNAVPPCKKSLWKTIGVRHPGTLAQGPLAHHLLIATSPITHGK